MWSSTLVSGGSVLDTLLTRIVSGETTQRSINIRLAEHKRQSPEESAVVEHAFRDENHVIKFDRTKVLFTVTHFLMSMHIEAIEIHKKRSNFNRREKGITVHRAWHPQQISGKKRIGRTVAPQPAVIH